jgi:choline-sulfatase
MGKRPNIVLLMADQHRADMMACAGDPVARTPNMDWLAQQGVRFDRTYCQGPLCMPARTSLVTERFVRDHGVFENSSEIPKGMPTFLNKLDEAGYHTAEVGKMHLWMHGGRRVGHTANMIPFLQELGFDDAIETVGKLASYGHDSAYTDYLQERGLLKTYRSFIGAQKHCGAANANEHKGDLAGWSAAPGPLSGEDYVDVWHGRRAVEWIEQYNDEKPFFLWVGFPGPHDPFDAPADAVGAFAGADIPMPGSVKRPDVPEDDGPFKTFIRRMLAYSDSATMDDAAIVAMRRAYYANIALIDDAVGRIVGALQKRNFLEDTWVIYTSDHGEMMGEHRLMAKMVFYEPAVKVPLIVRPPKGTASRVVHEPVQLMDLAATFREIAGAGDIPDSAASSLAAAVTDNKKPLSPAAIASENFGFAMFLTDRHKLVVYEDDVSPVSLFDMEQDPFEDHNLVKEKSSQGIVEAMMENHAKPFLATKPLRPHVPSPSKRR